MSYFDMILPEAASRTLDFSKPFGELLNLLKSICPEQNDWIAGFDRNRRVLVSSNDELYGFRFDPVNWGVCTILKNHRIHKTLQVQQEIQEDARRLYHLIRKRGTIGVQELNVLFQFGV